MEQEGDHNECYGCGEQKCTTPHFGYNLCVDCENKLDDKTGYCSLDCCLGHGCDGSC